MAKFVLGDSVYVGAKTPLTIVKPYRPSFEPPPHRDAVLNTIFPKSILNLKSMKYLPVLQLTTSRQPTQVAFAKTKKIKRDVGKRSEPAVGENSLEDLESGGSRHFVKIESPSSHETARQKPIVPSWSTLQYNRRPIINTPWMKDTQGIAMTTMNTINGAMLELSDSDIQRETAKANLVLVQRMGELVLAEKEKVKAEMSRVHVDLERMVSERDRNQMEVQKLEMEKEMFEAKLMSGTARASSFRRLTNEKPDL